MSIKAKSVTAADEWTPAAEFWGTFNYSVSDTFTATWVLQKSYDEGTTWLDTPKTGSDKEEGTYSEPEQNVQYRLGASAYTDGTVECRLGQLDLSNHRVRHLLRSA